MLGCELDAVVEGLAGVDEDTKGALLEPMAAALWSSPPLRARPIPMPRPPTSRTAAAATANGANQDRDPPPLPSDPPDSCA